MKVAFYVYPVAFQSPGGGEVLLLKTKEYLEKLGLPIKLFDPWRDRLKDFDILHTFGSVKDALRMMETAHELGVKNVLSTVCWYSLKSAWGAQAKLSGRIPAVSRYLAKAVLPSLPSQRKRMMQCADLLIPNSETESNQLRRFFQVPDSKIETIPNAVDEWFLEATPDLFHEKYPHRDFTLCVGRIEPRKNQLGVVRALKGSGLTVVFIGDYVTDYRDYYEQCRKEADGQMHFLGGLPHSSDVLRSAYAACNTFLLATWLETPGLAALEAGLAGAKVVITQEGATREYFSDYATYVPPEKTDIIRKKVLEVFEAPKTAELSEHIRSHFLWPQVAKKTFQAYEKCLKV